MTRKTVCQQLASTLVNLTDYGCRAVKGSRVLAEEEMQCVLANSLTCFRAFVFDLLGSINHTYLTLGFRFVDH